MTIPVPAVPTFPPAELTLTRSGKKQLGEETAQWNHIALAIGRALEA